MTTYKMCSAFIAAALGDVLVHAGAALAVVYHLKNFRHAHELVYAPKVLGTLDAVSSR